MGILITPKKLLARLGLWQRLLLACGLLLTISALLFWWQSTQVSRQIDAELARIRAAGEPVTADDLNAYYRIPDAEEDCTQLWLQAFRTLENSKYSSAYDNLPIVGFGDNEIPPPAQPWKDLKAAEQFLKDYQESLRLLHEAASKGGAARYPLDFSQFPEKGLPEVGRIRYAARHLSLEAHVRAHQHDPLGVTNSIQAIFGLANSLKYEPTLLSLLVRISIKSVGRERIRRLLPYVDFSDQSLQNLQKDLRSTRYHDAVRTVLLGERVIVIRHIEDPSWVPSLTGMNSPEELLWRLTWSQEFLEYLNCMRQVIVAAKRPWPEALRSVEKAEKEANASNGSKSFLAKYRFLITLQIAPAFNSAYRETVRCSTLNNAADVAIALKRYHIRHGMLPERLDQLVPEFLPEVPTDPFDGKPLRYLRRENELVIYSVGPDGIDNGGQGNTGGKPDLVFSVESFE